MVVDLCKLLGVMLLGTPYRTSMLDGCELSLFLSTLKILLRCYLYISGTSV